jgi:competence protein ComFC
MQVLIKDHLNACLDLLLPNKCHLCDTTDKNSICNTCLSAIKPSPQSIFNTLNTKQVFSFCIYKEEIKQLLSLLKFEKHSNIGDLLSQILYNNRQLIPYENIDYWIPVPIHHKRLKSRGFNQVDILFKDTIATFPGQYYSAIKRTKNTKPLYSLNTAERQALLQNSFDIEHPDLVKGKRVVLIDDILTSGTTIQQIAQLLHDYGAKEVSALTLAYTPSVPI